MPHVLRPLSNKTLVQSYEGQSYKNAAGNAECVEFIKQTLNAPPTMAWQEGKKVIQGDASITAGTAIATFVNRKYSHAGYGDQHAAIYLRQDEIGIIVLDQFRKQGEVKVRAIPWKPHRPGLSNDGKAFSIIEW